ncbi:MAG: hypothetical protein AABZ39_03440 [Spirochaetota bacterium]
MYRQLALIFSRLAVPAVLLFTGMSAFGTGEEYRMKIAYNGSIIGSNHVRITHRPGGEADYIVKINAVMPILFLTFTLDRTSYFTLDKKHMLVTYSNVSRTTFPGYEYDMYATNFGSNVVIHIIRGTSTETRVVNADAYDYLTGGRYADKIGPERTNATLRFLDLDSIDVYPADFSFVTNYTKFIGGKKEEIYELSMRSGFLSQRVTVMTRVDIPILLELYLPFIGWTRTELTGTTIADSLMPVLPASAGKDADRVQH